MPLASGCVGYFGNVRDHLCTCPLYPGLWVISDSLDFIPKVGFL